MIRVLHRKNLSQLVIEIENTPMPGGSVFSICGGQGRIVQMSPAGIMIDWTKRGDTVPVGMRSYGDVVFDYVC